MPDTSRRINECVSTIVKSIMSGNNSCGTFQTAVQSGGSNLSNYLAKMVVPTVRVLVEEVEQARSDRLAEGSTANSDRFVLEMVAQNLGGAVQITDFDIIAQLESRLGRRLL